MRAAFQNLRGQSGRSSLSGMNPLESYVSVSQALVVADDGSISPAAQVLGVRQSAVSRRIQTLKNEIGVSPRRTQACRSEKRENQRAFRTKL